MDRVFLLIVGNLLTARTIEHSLGITETDSSLHSYENCGCITPEPFGGELTTSSPWPWMVAIYRRTEGVSPDRFICGGSLITHRHILTAGHCLLDDQQKTRPASYFFVKVGSTIRKTADDFSVAKVIVHDNVTQNDIALIILAASVAHYAFFAPICLPPPEMDIEYLIGHNATVLGWGRRSNEDSFSEMLKENVVPVLPNDVCGKVFPINYQHTLCAGQGKNGDAACSGDSGGPLMIEERRSRWVILGLVSYGESCERVGYPNVYTQVSHYTDWIKSQLKQLRNL